MSHHRQSSDYDAYLASLHANRNTSDELIARIITEGTGKSLLTKQRIIAGEANEVYDITLTNGDSVILRISNDEDKNFKQEQWAINQCKNMGLPVPAVLYITEIREKDNYLAFCIQEKLHGELLERGTITMSSMDQSHLKKIIIKAGITLAQIHSVKTKQFGYIDGEGRGEYTTYIELLGEDSKHKEQFITLCKDSNVPEKIMRRAFDLIDNYLKTKPVISPVLNHNDFGPKHIMFIDETITGILDFGEVSSHSYVNDLARWDYWHSETVPLEWLLEGYAKVAPLTSDFHEQLQIIKIVNGLSTMWWYYDQDYPKGVSQAAEKLLKDVKLLI
ncbi:MAG: aminoglycoside phosphotransferase family protein [Candidatus Roizmanbacteria bacterium]|nr:aminoglycoside phosphotransferase family protein [Candidatus Roizmanbacteria bacterium]